MEADINDFERIAHAYKENIDKTPHSDEFVGVTTAEIQNFEVGEHDYGSEFKMSIILPWGESSKYTSRTKNIFQQECPWFNALKQYHSIDMDEFKKTKGSEIPVGIKFYKMKNNGEISSRVVVHQDVLDLYNTTLSDEDSLLDD